MLDKLSPSNPSLIVRVWPDESWAVVEDIGEGEYGWRSDDVLHVDLYDPECERKLNPGLYAEIVEGVMGPDPHEPTDHH